MESVAPPQLDSASHELRAQLYYVLDTGPLNFVTELTGCMSTGGEGSALQFEEPVAVEIVQPGNFVLALLHEGIQKLACLYFIKQGPTSQDEVHASEEKTRGEEKESADTVEGSERKSDTDREKSEEEEMSEEEKTSKGEKNYWLQIRMWPTYAVLVLFDGDCWKLTRQHRIHWIQQNQAEELLKRISTETERSEAHTTGDQALSSLSKDNMFRLELQGTLEWSDAVEKLINSELNPGMDDFRVSEVLGRGSTCKVYRGAYVYNSLGGVQYALKKMELTKSFDDIGVINNKEPREVAILSCLNEPNVVSFYQAWIVNGIYKSYLKGSAGSEPDSWELGDESDDGVADIQGPKYVVIHMECCSRALGEVISIENRELDVDNAWPIFKGITQALKCIHRNGVIHRDLKPGNIFFVSPGTNEMKIGDLGHACLAKNYVDGQRGTPNRGTFLYCAPELDDGTDLTDKVDIYSLGVILVELFCGFKSSHERTHVLDHLRRSEYPTDWNGDMVLLKQLTAICPSQRPSADEILEYIANHNYC